MITRLALQAVRMVYFGHLLPYGYYGLLHKIIIMPYLGIFKSIVVFWFYVSFPFQRDVLVLIYFILKVKAAKATAWFPW
jgi:hypothetical protein